MRIKRGIKFMRGSRKIFRGGPNLITFFCLFLLVNKRIEDTNTAINEPSSAASKRHQTLNADLVIL